MALGNWGLKEASQHRRYGTKEGRQSHHQRTPSFRFAELLLPVSLLFLGNVSEGTPQAPTSIDDERADPLANTLARQLSTSTSPSTDSSTTSWSTTRKAFYNNHPYLFYDVICDPPYLGDGNCDPEFNYEICDFDGGDCCEETCFDVEERARYKCGKSGYDCWDPDQGRETIFVSEYYTTDYVLTCIDIWINDGECDSQNNREECAFDGGDCCQESCVDAKYTCGKAWGFDCQDPAIASPAPTPTLFNRTCEDKYNHIGDGQCHDEYNLELCSFDGGDCCAPTCIGWSCGRDGYDCLDPETDDYGPDCNMEYIGDGECDPATNTQECHYDGGDCCQETCVDSTYACSPFDCQDPHVMYSAATKSTIVSDFLFGVWLMMWAGVGCFM